jgi:hypothetical protein
MPGIVARFCIIRVLSRRLPLSQKLRRNCLDQPSQRIVDRQRVSKNLCHIPIQLDKLSINATPISTADV